MSSRAREKRRAREAANRPAQSKDSSGRDSVVQNPIKEVDSLLTVMKDGNEYESIVASVRRGGELVPDLQQAIRDIEAVRKRPCICYVANVVKPVAQTEIGPSDHLPFAEMVASLSPHIKEVDVLLATPGGSAEQVVLFVEALRPRFESVEFLIPYKCMSAGTLWALSGDRIWMDDRAFLGPIDPQVPTADGMFVPAQALLALLQRIQAEGQAELDAGRQPPWTYIQLLRYMDQKQLGAAISWSGYVVDIAKRYLQDYKFRAWAMHRTTHPGQPVTPEERADRAFTVAKALCAHDRWKAHGHGISRDVLWNEVHLEIDRPESVPGLQRALRRTWALLYYAFDKVPIIKLIFSSKYMVARFQAPAMMQRTP